MMKMKLDARTRTVDGDIEDAIRFYVNAGWTVEKRFKAHDANDEYVLLKDTAGSLGLFSLKRRKLTAGGWPIVETRVVFLAS